VEQSVGPRGLWCKNDSVVCSGGPTTTSHIHTKKRNNKENHRLTVHTFPTTRKPPNEERHTHNQCEILYIEWTSCKCPRFGGCAEPEIKTSGQAQNRHNSPFLLPVRRGIESCRILCMDRHSIPQYTENVSSSVSFALLRLLMISKRNQVQGATLWLAWCTYFFAYLTKVPRQNSILRRRFSYPRAMGVFEKTHRRSVPTKKCRSSR
jgi:hypothetical protein